MHIPKVVIGVLFLDLRGKLLEVTVNVGSFKVSCPYRYQCVPLSAKLPGKAPLQNVTSCVRLCPNFTASIVQPGGPLENFFRP